MVKPPVIYGILSYHTNDPEPVAERSGSNISGIVLGDLGRLAKIIGVIKSAAEYQYFILGPGVILLMGALGSEKPMSLLSIHPC